MADLDKCRLARRHSIILFSRETGAKVELGDSGAVTPCHGSLGRRGRESFPESMFSSAKPCWRKRLPTPSAFNADRITGGRSMRSRHFFQNSSGWPKISLDLHV